MVFGDPPEFGKLSSITPPDGVPWQVRGQVRRGDRIIAASGNGGGYFSWIPHARNADAMNRERTP